MDAFIAPRKNDVAFIIGTGRCGTTMLAQILNAHSKICVPIELQLFFEHSNNGKRLYELFSSGKNLGWVADDFIRMVASISPHRFDLYFDYESFFRRQSYPIKSLAGLLHRLYGDICKAKGKEILIEQTPWYGQRMDVILQFFPDAKFIHMVRDGRDVALSFSRTPWWDSDPRENLNIWATEASKMRDDATRLLPGEQYLEMKYESFIGNPEKSLGMVTGFLGVSCEKGMLLPENMMNYRDYSKAKHSDSFSSEQYRKWNERREQAVFSDNVYGWKRDHTETFSSLTLQEEDALRRFGYDA